MFPLSAEDKSQLKRLNDNASAIFSLKKLFLNTALKETPSDVNTLAAQRLALDIIKDTFNQLRVIQPDSRESGKGENLV